MLHSHGLAACALCLAMLAGCAGTGMGAPGAPAPPATTPSPVTSSTPAISRASTSTAPLVAPDDSLTISGIGGLTLGMSRDALLSSRAMVATEDLCEGSLVTGEALKGQGITLVEGVGLGQIWLTTSTHSTKSGARVGMTMAQIRTIYGADVTRKTLTYGASAPRKVDVYVYIAQGNMIIFRADSERANDSDVVSSIVLKTNDGYGIADDDAC